MAVSATKETVWTIPAWLSTAPRVRSVKKDSASKKTPASNQAMNVPSTPERTPTIQNISPLSTAALTAQNTQEVNTLDPPLTKAILLVEVAASVSLPTGQVSPSSPSFYSCSLCPSFANGDDSNLQRLSRRLLLEPGKEKRPLLL